jgi:hypothetical protein
MAPSRRANSLSSLRLQDFNSQPTAFFHNSSTHRQQRSVSHAPDKPIDSHDLPNASCSKSHLYSRRMSNLTAYVDGGSRGNPGPSGIGVVIDGYPSGPSGSQNGLATKTITSQSTRRSLRRFSVL